ncbi:MAG: FAD-dependent monooxygenase [Opitutaceae bacterium]
MSSTRPIEIIGGGLAGLSLGLALQNAGIAVRVIEAGNYPRHRVCGDFMTGLSNATVQSLGLKSLLADALQHQQVAWFYREQLICAQRLPSPALGLSRFTLDARLAHAFTAAGGELHRSTRAIDSDSVPGRILAHGRSRSESPWLGLKFHVHDLDLAQDLELHLGDEAYIGLAKVETGAVNVCGLFRRRNLTAPGPALLVAYLNAVGLPRLADRIARATFETGSFSAISALSYESVIPAPDTIRLGDAGGLIPPFTGNGMAIAFQSAETALPHVIAYARSDISWSVTCNHTNNALRRRFQHRLALARSLQPLLLAPNRQRFVAALARAHLLPLRLLYTLLH